MVVLGAIAGGFLTQDEDISKVLWLAGTLKIAIAVVWMFWKSKGSVRLE
jgi:predicted MFS family arabinose efflux permease